MSPCICLFPIHWSQVIRREWRCSWSSADRRCSNYTWVINNFIAYKGASYVKGFTVYLYHIHTDPCWPAISRWYFQIHFLVRILLHELVSIGPVNNMPNLFLIMTCHQQLTIYYLIQYTITNDYIVYWYIHASRGLYICHFEESTCNLVMKYTT